MRMVCELYANKLAILLAVGLILPVFSLAQQPITLPKTLEEAKGLGEKIIEVGQKELPEILGKIWKEEVLPVWQKIGEWFKENVWQKVERPFKKEIEKGKPIIEEEFKKEKKELKEEFPKVGKSLWERIKELIK